MLIASVSAKLFTLRFIVPTVLDWFFWLLSMIAGLQEGVKIAVTDNELRNQANQRKYQSNSGDNDAVEACERLLRELPTPASLAVSFCLLSTLNISHVLLPFALLLDSYTITLRKPYVPKENTCGN